MHNIIFLTPLHLFRPFSERKPQEIFPYVLSMESSIQYLDSVKYHFHTIKKFSTLAVDWLEDTHQGRVEALVRALPLHQCGLGSILAQTQYVRLVCWFSTLLQEVIPSVLQVSPLTKNQQQKQKNLLCNCAPRNTQRLSILLLLELQNFLPIII